MPPAELVLFAAAAIVFLVWLVRFGRRNQREKCNQWAIENGYRFVRVESYGYDNGPRRFIVENDRGLWRTRVDDGEVSWWADDPDPNTPEWDFSVTSLSLSEQSGEQEDDGWREPW